MPKAEIVTRKRGRPTTEESIAINTEKAILHARSEFARLTPQAIKTLEGLLTSGTEKVKETTAKYILEQAEKANNLYTMEDNEEDLAGGSTSASSDTHKGPSDVFKDAIPLTTQIREYKIAEGEN
jgi:hypothetical protein